MALVDYSDSEDDDDEKDEAISLVSKLGGDRQQDSTPASKSDLPPLPSQFHNLYAARVRSRDDPSLHDGRTRSTPHIEGNWPSHIYIEWYPTLTETEKLSLVISYLQAQLPNVNSLLASDMGATLPLHISLSPPIGLLTAQKDVFLETATNSITSSTIRPFRVKFTSLDWVSNFEQTRWFLVMRLETPPENELNRILGRCNEVGEEFGQPPLYESRTSTEPKPSPPSKKRKLQNNYQAAPMFPKARTSVPAADGKFHVSIAWMLTPPDKTTLKATKAVEELRFPEVRKLHIDVNEIKVKIGNIVTSVGLPEKAKIEKGLF